MYNREGNKIWIATNNGLALFNPQTEEFISFLHDPNNPHSLIADNIHHIREMSNGELWIVTYAGEISILNLRSITLKNPQMVQFYHIAATNDHTGLSSSEARTLFQDSFGNIWIDNQDQSVDFISNAKPVFQTIPYMTVKRGEQKKKPGVDKSDISFIVEKMKMSHSTFTGKSKA